MSRRKIMAVIISSQERPRPKPTRFQVEIKIGPLWSFPDGLQSLAKVFHPFGCADIWFTSAVREWMCNLMPHVVREWYALGTLRIVNIFNNSLKGPGVGGMLQCQISVPIQHYLIVEWQSKFPRSFSSYVVSVTRPTYLSIVKLVSSWT